MINKEYLIDLFEKASTRTGYSWLTYQPINCPGFENTFHQSGRKCSDRSEKIIDHIKNNIPDYLNKIYVDWGCNLGFFIFELMKNDMSCLGVDRKQKYIDVCEFIASEYLTYTKPIFYKDDMTIETIKKYRADVGLCFSVFHHIKEGKIPLMVSFADNYKMAYIEMDGHNYGYNLLKIMYWDINFIVEANDPYGSGTRKRKTWFCSNDTINYSYNNIKYTNYLSGRGVFKKIDKNNSNATVVKRETLSFEHTWLRTNIQYESDMYKKYKTKFLPNLINYIPNTADGDRILEIEFIDENSQKGASLDEIFDWLKNNKLRILDCGASQFLKTKNGFVLVDLESIVPEDHIQQYLKKEDNQIKSAEEQITYLKQRLL